jgi:hypothetical protein
MEDSETYRLGWRFTEGVGADGPGTSIFGIQRGSIECVVRWDQPAWIDDQGEHQQSDVLTVIIQCREGTEGPVSGRRRGKSVTTRLVSPGS